MEILLGKNREGSGNDSFYGIVSAFGRKDRMKFWTED
jgi:hypothetical protein